MKSNWIIIPAIILLVILIVGAGAFVITYYVTKNDELKTHLKAFLSGVKRLAYGNTTLFAGLGVFLLALALCNLFYFFGQQKTSNWFIRGLKYAQVVDNIDSIEIVPANDYRARLYYTNVKVETRTVKFMGLNLPPTKNCRVQRMYEQLTDVSFQAYNHLLTAREFMVQSFCAYPCRPSSTQLLLLF